MQNKLVRLALEAVWRTLVNLGIRPTSIVVTTDTETYMLLEGENAQPFR